MTRVTDYLAADHRRLHDLLEAAIAGEPFAAEAFAGFRAGLLRHIAIEEKLLFPAAGRAAGEPPAWTHLIRIEHAAISSLLIPTPDAALGREIRSILEGHDAREEGPDGIYEECERLLSPGESAALAAEAAAYPEVKVAPYRDGRAPRTAADALAAARRKKPPP
jgi:hypothetical protein